MSGILDKIRRQQALQHEQFEQLDAPAAGPAAPAVEAPAPSKSAQKRAAKAQRAAEEEERRAAFAAKQAKAPAVNPEQWRLPHGATFHVEYDATAILWRGSLTIGDAVFTGEASGVFGLLKALDRMFRQPVEQAK